MVSSAVRGRIQRYERAAFVRRQAFALASERPPPCAESATERAWPAPVLIGLETLAPSVASTPRSGPARCHGHGMLSSGGRAIGVAQQVGDYLAGSDATGSGEPLQRSTSVALHPVSPSRSRISASSAFASFVTDAILLQNISARSSRARVRATWTMHANSAIRFFGATLRITAASGPSPPRRRRRSSPPRCPSATPGVAERVDPSKLLHSGI